MPASSPQHLITFYRSRGLLLHLQLLLLLPLLPALLSEQVHPCVSEKRSAIMELDANTTDS